MQNQLYVALSAQLALTRRLETLAHNVANVSTAGYRAEEISFESLISERTIDPLSFVSKGENYVSMRPGGIKHTGNPLDVAVSGEAWLAFESPRGVVLTRDGRLRIDPNGDLVTINGHRVLDAGNSPIQLDPNGGAPIIGADGSIEQNGTRMGRLGLFATDPQGKFDRFGNSGIIPATPPTPQLDSNAATIMQGHIESANVDAVGEMSKLIVVQRSFEAIAATLAELESTMTEAIRGLSGNG